MHDKHMTFYTDSYPLNSNEKLWSYSMDVIGQKRVKCVLFRWWACGLNLDMFTGFSRKWGRKGLKEENNEKRFPSANFLASSQLIIPYKTCWERHWRSFYSKYRVFLNFMRFTGKISEKDDDQSWKVGRNHRVRVLTRAVILSCPELKKKYVV